MFKIIENCSPYYIRFTHHNLDEVIKRSRCAVSDVNFTKQFTHHRLLPNQVEYIKEVCPLFNIFDLNSIRVSMFVSQPGLYYRAHKDGLNHRFSLNYTVKILDDKCVTSWYSDQELSHYPIDNLPTRSSRECVGFIKENHTPLKTMVAQPDECILFNTELFHDWDNRASYNERMVLTLRLASYADADANFDNARNIILNLAKSTED